MAAEVVEVPRACLFFLAGRASTVCALKGASVDPEGKIGDDSVGWMATDGVAVYNKFNECVTSKTLYILKQF